MEYGLSSSSNVFATIVEVPKITPIYYSISRKLCMIYHCRNCKELYFHTAAHQPVRQ